MNKLNLLCYHGSPGVPEEFKAFQNCLKAATCTRITREGYPGSDETEITKPAVLLGYSFGCAAAIHRALEAPEKVLGIVLVAPYVFPENRLRLIKKALIQAPVIGDMLLKKAGERIVNDLLEKSASPSQIPSSYWTVAEKMAKPESLRTAALEKEKLGLDRASLSAAAEALRTFSIPVALIYGEQDQTSSSEGQIEPIIEILKPELKVKIPSAGHALPWTHPQKVAQIVDEWLNTIAPKTLEKLDSHND